MLQFKEANPEVADCRNYQRFRKLYLALAISDLLTISSQALHIGHGRFGGVTKCYNTDMFEVLLIYPHSPSGVCAPLIMHECTWVHMSIHGYTLSSYTCMSIQRYTRVYTCVYMGIHEYTLVYMGIHFLSYFCAIWYWTLKHAPVASFAPCICTIMKISNIACMHAFAT